MQRNLKSLNDNHIRFIEHYIMYGNATQAYLVAYPNTTYTSAKADGWMLLQEPLIKDELEDRREKLAIANQITKTDIINELVDSAYLAKSDGKYNDYAKMKDMIIKMFGYYEADKVEHLGMPISITLNLNEDEE